MSSIRSKIAGVVVGGACDGFLGGVIGTATGAASGAVGAGMLKAAGHASYAVAHAAESGAVGGAILGFGTGAVLYGVRSSLACCGLFSLSEENKRSCLKSTFFVVGSALLFAAEEGLSCVIGDQILKSSQHSSMNPGQMFAAGAAGSGVVYVGLGLTIACLTAAAFCAVCCCATAAATASVIVGSEVDSRVEAGTGRATVRVTM